MTLLEDYKKAYETGLPFFLKLFKMSDSDLKDKLKSILKNKLNSRNLDLLEKSSDVIRTIRNENPEKISIQFYISQVNLLYFFLLSLQVYLSL